MSEHPNPSPEERLRHFLRQYRPLPSPAAPDLENRILRVVAALPPHRQTKQFWRWVGLSLLAAALLGWVGYRRWQVQVLAQETEALESFLQLTWRDLLIPDEAEEQPWRIERDLLDPQGS